MSVERSYGRALLEAATESGLKGADLDRIEKELGEFVSALESSKELRELLSSPVVSKAEKGDITGAVAKKMGLSPLVERFLTVVARKGRGPVVEDLVDAFTVERLQSEGAILGSVASADPLKQEDLAELAAAFSKKLGKKVVFKASVEPTLLAGLKVTVNGITYDGSLRSQLNQLKDCLVYGKSGANH